METEFPHSEAKFSLSQQSMILGIIEKFLIIHLVPYIQWNQGHENACYSSYAPSYNYEIQDEKDLFCFRQWLYSRLTTGWPCGVHADYTEYSECLQDGRQLSKTEGKRNHW